MTKRFITQRELNLIDSLDRELIQHVVGQEVKYYAVSVPETSPHRLYKEAIKKTWSPPVRINARVLWENQNTKTTQMGLDSSYAAEVYFHKKELRERNVQPREGDYLEFGNVVFEITSVTEPDIIFGKIDQKSQTKCVCIPSREGQMQVSSLFGQDVDNTHPINTEDVDPMFSRLQTLGEPFGGTTKVIREIIGSGTIYHIADDDENGLVPMTSGSAEGYVATVVSGSPAWRPLPAGNLPAVSGIQYAVLMENPAGVPVFAPLTADMIAAAWSVSMAGSQTLEVSQTVSNPAFTAAYPSGRPPVAAVLTDTDGNAPVNVIGSPTSFNSPYSFQKNTYGGGVTFTLTANESGGGSKTSNTSFTWLQRVYYGVATPGTLDQAFVTALSSNPLASSRSRTFSVNAGSGQKIYYVFRSAYGTPTFTVGGFAGGFSLATTISITNTYGFSENYDVWVSDNSSLGSTTVVVS